MPRPRDGLTPLTCRRLDAAVALGVREIWTDSANGGSVEPLPVERWACVLQWPGFPLRATGSTSVEEPSGPETAARQALACLEEFVSLAAVTDDGLPHRDGRRASSGDREEPAA